MVAPPSIRVRIGRLVLPGIAPGNARAVEHALRTELARLAPGLGHAAGHPGPVALAPLRAATPAGQGREAATRIAAHITGTRP